jgi:hypothetical protein
MTPLTLSTPPPDLAEAMARVAQRDEHILIECNGMTVALVSVRDLELLERRIEALEDRIDNEAADRALAEPGESIPYEKIREELGLT